jgi:glycosyltransferase involved in cell wall biosynthesis
MYLLKTKGKKIVFWSERPGIYGNMLKKIQKMLFLSALHRYYALKYQNKIKVFLPLGTLGVKTFKNYGWKKEILFPFMYDPPYSGEMQKTTKKTENVLRLLYVGRFARSTKGLDVLLKALEKIAGDNWRIDLVGGYGEYKDYTIS